MYRSVFLAALAGTAAIVAIGHVSMAQSTVMSPEDRDICLLLEFAHESTCGEYELIHHGTPDAMVTGSVAPIEATAGTARPAQTPVRPKADPAGN